MKMLPSVEESFAFTTVGLYRREMELGPMASSDIKATWRTLYREKSYALINLCGLSLAIACCLILGLYLRSELTYDQHNTRHKQIYRIEQEVIVNGAPTNFALSSIALGPVLQQNYPEVKDYVRLRPASDQKALITIEGKKLFWDKIYYSDANVFDIFTHRFLYGDPKSALNDPSSAAVSESFARKYFGNANPIGKTLQADLFPTIPRKITAVFRDLPENTHLKYNVLFRDPDTVSYTPNPRQLLNIRHYTYLIMPENYNVAAFKTISDSLFNRFMAEIVRGQNIKWRAWVQPLAKIHLNSDVGYDLPTGNKYYIFGFSAVGIFILLVACINYVNLAMARGAKRAKEIGMRKILGISRMHLIFRFFFESISFSLISMIVGIILVKLALKLTPMDMLFGKPLGLDLLNEPLLLVWMLGLGLVVGLIAGIYPAVYLSSIQPLSALASTRGGKKGSFRLRQTLVLLQFTVSVVVIACTFIMALQMRYISHKPLGFDKQNRIIVTLTGKDVVLKYQQLKTELLTNSRVLGVTASSHMIGVGQDLPTSGGMVEGKAGVKELMVLNNIQVDDNFVPTMGMQLATGRDFTKRLLTDFGSSFVVNETMAKIKGWQDPLGKHIQVNAGATEADGKVIGVLKDFHFKSLHVPVEPFVISPFAKGFDFGTISEEQSAALRFVMIVHLSSDDVQRTLGSIQQTFSQFDPRHPFEYRFLDDAIDALYMSETRLMRMTGIFSGICIFISCLGLFGLAAYTTEQRRKEIGIRKILGSSAFQIILLLSRQILLLVLAGAVIASIVAYYAMNQWLSGFAYRLGINPLVFVISSLLVIAVAFITIALQSYKTAQRNPAHTLRYE
jgi:putative ABC transport system permease protein